MTRLQEALDLIAEAGVDPTDGDQEQSEDDEADDAGEGLQIAEVPEEELQGADQEQRQAGEAEHSIAEGEAGCQKDDGLYSPGDGEHVAGDFVVDQGAKQGGGEQGIVHAREAAELAAQHGGPETEDGG